MYKLNRKKIPVCLDCHNKNNQGKYEDLALKDLKGPFKNKI